MAYFAGGTPVFLSPSGPSITCVHTNTYSPSVPRATLNEEVKSPPHYYHNSSLQCFLNVISRLLGAIFCSAAVSVALLDDSPSNAMRANLLRSRRTPHFSLWELIQVNVFLEKQAEEGEEGGGAKWMNTFTLNKNCVQCCCFVLLFTIEPPTRQVHFIVLCFSAKYRLLLNRDFLNIFKFNTKQLHESAHTFWQVLYK